MKLPSKRSRLPRSFYERPTELVARELLGKALLRRVGEEWLGGLIVETEAYLASGDLASHSARGETRSNAAMFGRPGTLYVYPIHAKYCMNVVTDPMGQGSAVLLRALEPVWGIEQMMRNRSTSQLRQLTRGPAMLCQALAVDRAQDKTDLVKAAVAKRNDRAPIEEILATDERRRELIGEVEALRRAKERARGATAHGAGASTATRGRAAACCDPGR